VKRLLSVLWLFCCGLAWGSLPRDSFARLDYAALYQDLTWGTTAGVSLVNGTNWFQLNLVSLSGVYTYPTVTQMLPVTVNFTYDDNRNLLADGTRNFTYDDANRLIEVYVTNSWNNWRSTYAYDGLSRRRIRQDYTRQGSSWVLNNETHYIYGGSTVIQERNALNQPTVTYTRGNGLLARTDSNGTCYYHADGNHNVTALVNSQGTLVARYIYDPYGNLLEEWGAMADANVYRFASQEVHPLSGLYAYPFRFYDPNLGRWINRDPIGFWGGRNPFAFVGNNPINCVDPLGLSWYGDVFNYVGDEELMVADAIKQFFLGPPGGVQLKDPDILRAGSGLIEPIRDANGNDITSALLAQVATSLVTATLMGPEREGATIFGNAVKCKRLAKLGDAAKAVEEALAVEGGAQLPATLYHYTGEGNVANILEKG